MRKVQEHNFRVCRAQGEDQHKIWPCHTGCRSRSFLGVVLCLVAAFQIPICVSHCYPHVIGVKYATVIIREEADACDGSERRKSGVKEFRSFGERWRHEVRVSSAESAEEGCGPWHADCWALLA